MRPGREHSPHRRLRLVPWALLPLAALLVAGCPAPAPRTPPPVERPGEPPAEAPTEAPPPVEVVPPAEAPFLAGAWEGDDDTGFLFRPDGTAVWFIPRAGEPDVFEIRYRLLAFGSRFGVDLTGFGRGPLSGRTLYCLGEMLSSERFLMDCEPGPPGSATERPTAFGTSTRTYTLVEED